MVSEYVVSGDYLFKKFDKWEGLQGLRRIEKFWNWNSCCSGFSREIVIQKWKERIESGGLVEILYYEYLVYLIRMVICFF